MPDTFGDFIKTKRLEKDLSLRDLGKITGLDFSYIGRLEKGGPTPSRETVEKLASALSISKDLLLTKAGYIPSIKSIQRIGRVSRLGSNESSFHELELADILDNSEFKITEGGEPLTDEKRKSLIEAIKNPDKVGKHSRIHILGSIRAGIPLLADDNYQGELEIPADIRADFALQVRGDSMIGAGIHEGDYAICRQQNTANNGDIVVALHDVATGSSDATLKYFFNNNGQPVLRAANPNYKDIPVTEGYRIAGIVVAILKKEPPSYHMYQEYISTKDYSLQEWNEVIEKAIVNGIKPSLISELIETQVEIARRLAGK